MKDTCKIYKVYNWVACKVDQETGDIDQIEHNKKFTDAVDDAQDFNDGCLVHDCIELRLSYCWGGNEGDEEEMTWAVFDIELQQLPKYFDNGEKIPKRFQQEIEREIIKWNKNCPF